MSIFYVYSTKIGENSDMSKCFENFVSQALGVLTRVYAAELRDNKNVNDATDRLKTYYSQAKKIERINGVGSSGSSSGAMGSSSGSSANTSSSDTSSSGSGSGVFGSSFNSSY